ncbi:MAG: hypothetical protein ACREKB_10275, partial [Candidatus Rokuibacteriota bacterium]
MELALLLGVVGVILVIVGPLLGISAYARVRRLESSAPDGMAGLTRRISALEQKLAQLQGRPPEATERPLGPARPLAEGASPAAVPPR